MPLFHIKIFVTQSLLFKYKMSISIPRELKRNFLESVFPRYCPGTSLAAVWQCHPLMQIRLFRCCPLLPASYSLNCFSKTTLQRSKIFFVPNKASKYYTNPLSNHSYCQRLLSCSFLQLHFLNLGKHNSFKVLQQ